jgi:hypothetical protein
MFQNFLSTDEKLESLSLNWALPIPGLIRVNVFDSDGKHGYVVIYKEKDRIYQAMKYSLLNGEIIWSTEVVNGGYGSPAVTDKYLLIHSNFSDIIALDKYTGSEIWNHKTNSRIRSSITENEGSIYVSSSDTIFELNMEGFRLNSYSSESTFFYGAVSFINGSILSLGTKPNEKSGDLIAQYDLGENRVVSSDTSGICLNGNIAYVGAENKITAIDLYNQTELWQKDIAGDCGRQMITYSDNMIFYTTSNGILGALSASSGKSEWTNTYDLINIVTPVTTFKNKLVVPINGELCTINKVDGLLLSKQPVGHSPYSALTINNGFALIGAGEPPNHGILVCFKYNNSVQQQTLSLKAELSNSYIESETINGVIRGDFESLKPKRITLATELIATENEIELIHMEKDTYKFSFQPKSNLLPSSYTIPVEFESEQGSIKLSFVTLKINTRRKLPDRHILPFKPLMEQKDYLHSGSCISQAIRKEFSGDHVPQENFREMVDKIKEKSGYEDFQIWRIILRRALTSQATNFMELPEFNKLDTNNG